MPRSQPHPFALFSLKPHNQQAHQIITHPNNSHLVSILSYCEDKGASYGLDVGFNIRSQSRNTLATLGRNNTDIIVEGSSIGRLQCSFEIEQYSGVVMLYDRSHGQTTQVFGDNVTPFEYGRLRRIVVQEGLNTIVGMGGVRCDLVQFELICHQGPMDTVNKIKSQDGIPFGQEEKPALARTEQIHTAGEPKLGIRFEKVGSVLGSGQFGTVHRCVDVDSGRFMAVKMLKRPSGMTQQAWKEELHFTLKGEVETLSWIRHPHIVDFIAAQGWDELNVQIFTGLKEGNLESLVESGDGPPELIASSVLPQMLQALDCLDYHSIVHRDVKPENILYTSRPGGQCQFQLGDFGLCNRVVDAKSFDGSLMYMAPEMICKGRQTSKLDVWSLFVTILWTLDAGQFRQRSKLFKNPEDFQQAVVHAASNIDILSTIKEMAVANPTERASAAQMLVKNYNGLGLSTPQHKVPALFNSPVSNNIIGSSSYARNSNSTSKAEVAECERGHSGCSVPHPESSCSHPRTNRPSLAACPPAQTR